VYELSVGALPREDVAAPGRLRDGGPCGDEDAPFNATSAAGVLTRIVSVRVGLAFFSVLVVVAEGEVTLTKAVGTRELLYIMHVQAELTA
jgi:hypothetical protein